MEVHDIGCDICTWRQTFPAAKWQTHCGNPACMGRLLLAPVAQGKKYIICGENRISMIGQYDVLYRCRKCKKDHIVGEDIAFTRNGQDIYSFVPVSTPYQRLAEEFRAMAEQLESTEKENSKLIKEKQGLESENADLAKEQATVLMDASQERDRVNNVKRPLDDTEEVDRRRRPNKKGKLSETDILIAHMDAQFHLLEMSVREMKKEADATHHSLLSGTWRPVWPPKRMSPSDTLAEGGEDGEPVKKAQKLTELTRIDYNKKLKEAVAEHEKKMEEVLEETERKLEAKNEEIERLETLLSEEEERAQRERSSSMETIAMYKEQLEKKIEEEIVVKQQVEGIAVALRGRLDAYEEEVKLLKQEKERLEQKAVDDGQKMKAYEEKLDLLKQEIEKTEREAKEAVSETHAYGERMKALYQEEGLKREAEDMKSEEMREAYEQKLELLKQKNEKAIEDMKECLEEKDEAMKDFLAELEQKDGLEKEMRKELEGLRNALKEQNEENERFRSNLDKAKVPAPRSTSSEASADHGKVSPRREKSARKAKK